MSNSNHTCFEKSNRIAVSFPDSITMYFRDRNEIWFALKTNLELKSLRLQDF